MKKILLVIVLIVVGLVAWRFFAGMQAGLVGPLMNDYQVHKEIVAGLQAARPFQTAIAQHYADGQRVCRSSGHCGLSAVSERTFGVDIGAHGIVTVAYKGISPRVDGKTVVLKPHRRDGGLFWDCVGGDVPAVYRPKSCRAKAASAR